MKRDMDLIREILLYAETHCSYFRTGSVPIKFDDVPNRKVCFHVELLHEAKFVTAHWDYKNTDPDDTWEITQTTYIQSLTWQGYEFLDKIRDDKQ